MSCVKETKTIKEYASQFPEESSLEIANLLGIWWERNPERVEELPSVDEMKSFMAELRDKPIRITVPYRLPGQNPQNYYVEGDRIFNKDGVEVFKEQGKHRNRVMANVAVKTGKAVVVTHRDKKYVVHNNGQIISVTTGDIMNWGSENGDRKAILNKAMDAFHQIGGQSSTTQKSTSDLTPSKTINIYAGTNENAHLSNFAIRPFSNSDITESNKVLGNLSPYWSSRDIKFQSVEQAFQFYKLAHIWSYYIEGMLLDETSEADKATIEAIVKPIEKAINEVLNTTNGGKLRQIGRQRFNNIDPKVFTEWDKYSSDVMKGLIKASFEQNSQASQQLLATGNATLTHTQDRGKWGKEFPRILMEVREELRGASQSSTIQELRFPSLIAPIVENFNGKWTRAEVANDSESLYIFTDNTDRDSGKGIIDSSSKYAKKYGQGKHYPTMTQAVIRGLDNAMPLSTQRWYHEGAKGVFGRWTDADFEEFKKVIDAEIGDIVREWNSGKYKRIIIANNDSFFNTEISNISMSRTPKLYSYLRGKLSQIGIGTTQSSTTQTTPKFKGKMSFAFGNQRAEGVTASTTLEAIKRGERTATTRYASDGNIDYWKQAKVGDVIEFTGQNSEKVLVRVTKELHQLPRIEQGTIKQTLAEAEDGSSYFIEENGAYFWYGETGDKIELTKEQYEEGIKNTVVTVRINKEGKNAEVEYAKEWSAKEGWDTSRFEQRVKPKIEKGEAYQMEFEYIQQDTTEPIEEAPASTMLDEALFPEEQEGSSFDIPLSPVSSIEEIQAVDFAFDPRVRRDRVSLIARQFSKEIDIALKERKDFINKKMMEENLTEDVREQLRAELYSLNRINIIKALTPGGIFDRVRKNMFEEYLNLSEEGRIQVELNNINRSKGADRYSEKEKYEAAKKRVTHKTVEYQKIVDHFHALTEEAAGVLLITEGIRVDPNYMAPSGGNLSEDDPEGNSNGTDILTKEETVKDGWMSNFREVSSHESLSQAVRKIIREIPALNHKGKYDKDDLGNQRYLDADYVHATLIDKLKDMITSEDMIPMLEELSKTKPWVKQIIKTLQSDDSLFSQFYQDFRKDFVEYWIQKRIPRPDGTYEIQTICLNKPEGINYLLDSWRDNYENGALLDDDSVYEKDGTINKENAAIGSSITDKLNNKFSNLDTQERLKLLESEEVWNDIIKLLHMIGVDPNPGILRVALTNIKESPGIDITDPIMNLLPQLHIIFNGIVEGKVQSKTNKDGTVVRGDLINTFSGVYNEIALLLAEVTEDAIESSVRENDKSYYAHVKPSYLAKMVKYLRNNRNASEEEFQKFIETEFKQYEWFYKDGKWRNDWIKSLVENPSLRKDFRNKVLLNYDKKEYKDWDDLDYSLVLFNEYRSEPKDKMAWYYVPILSDAPSAEFIRFKRYTNGSEIDEEGNKLTYQESILSRLLDLVNQEYDRIMLVRERDERIKRGEKIKPITNYDISASKDGKGGAKFCFIPALNDYTFEDGETFLDRFERLRNGSPSEFKKFLEDTLTDIMETGFEEAYQEWFNVGVFDELDNGMCKYIQFQGQSKTNSLVSNSLKAAKEKLGELFTPDMQDLLNKYSNNKPVIDKQANDIFNKIKIALNNKVLNNELTDAEYQNIIKNLTVKNNSKEAFREYYWNNTLATSQIIQILTTDLAFYENLEDFQKRFKEVHAPSLRLNTHSKFGRTWEKTIYIKDEKITSSIIEDLKQLLDEKVERNELTDIDRDYILSQYRKVNVTDAQAYRSLSSYRAILDMSGQWTDEMETAYKNLTEPNGKWTIGDFSIIWQTIKPFVYSQINNNSGTEHGGIKTPVQHKNSEFLLLAIYDAIAGPLKQSEKIRAINDFMEKNQIDVVQFISAVKVGNQGEIDLSGADDYDSVTKVLNEAAGYTSGQENPDVVHKVSYEDYGIQTETPEHAIDREQIIGTQIRKLITADIPDTAEITIEGVTRTKSEWLSLYHAINVENILGKFIEIDDIFKDPEKVEKILQEELSGNARYGIDNRRACTLDRKTGEFVSPLYDPAQSQRIQSLLNSIIKSRVTKQKIKGGSVIQVSSFGFTNKLNIKFEGEGKNKRIKYLECYMPAYSRKFFEPLMDENGLLDVNKLPDNLRKLIGYRVPTENKYSMLPLYIKGFLPPQNGSAIMLPAEITTITGSDFDIDKLYIMLYEFKVQNYDYKKAAKDFGVSNELMQTLSEMFKEGNPFESIVNTPLEFKEWFNINKESYRLEKPRIYKIKYDYNKLPQEQSLEARNNALIDMMWSILTNPDIASRVLTPGNFDKQKKAARIAITLESITEEELTKEGYSLEQLLTLSLDDLDKIASKYKRVLNPLSPRTQVVLHQQNMTGAKMIGIYANHNASHALMQHTKLGINSKEGGFRYAGKRKTSLHEMRNDNGEYITDNTSNFLAASVDNVKDNTLYATNQNTFTGDASMLLSRLGYNPIEIAILMRQPIVMEITRRYFRESRDGKSVTAIIKEVIKETGKWAKMYEDLNFSAVSEEPFELVPLMRAIMEYKNIANMSKEKQINFYRRQVAVGLLFNRILNTGDALGDLTQATRADTQGGGAGPSIADTIIKTQKVEDLLKNVYTNSKYPLSDADVILDNIPYTDKDELRVLLLNTPLPFLQAFYTLGVRMTERMLGRYFPQYKTSFKEVLDGKYDKEGNLIFEGLRDMTKTGKLDVKTINNIFNDLFAYILSKTEFFGSSRDISGEPISAYKKRRDFINNFPSYFNEVVENNPDIAELEFIQRLKVKKASKKVPVDVLVFRNVGTLSSTLRERYMREWTTLLHMNNPEAQKLALNLFLYNYYRNGIAFGPNTFGHLTPLTVRLNIPDYIFTLRDIMNNNDSFEQFIEQYVYNHLDNRKLVPQIPDTASTEFTTEEGEIKDEVVITINDNSTLGDEVAIKKESRNSEDEPVYEFMRFISKRIKGVDYYYKCTMETPDSAIYTRIEPLGYKYNFIEYEYGKEASEMTTAIDKNKKNSDSSDEFNSQFENTPNLDERETSIDTESTSEEYLSSLAISMASEQIYGESFEAPIEEDDITSIEPNEDYTDADDDIICG